MFVAELCAFIGSALHIACTPARIISATTFSSPFFAMGILMFSYVFRLAPLNEAMQG